MDQPSEQPPWIVRSYEPAFDDMMYLLGVGYTRSKAGQRARAQNAGKKGVVDPDEVARQKAFMRAHEPIWTWLLEHADVRLVCDRDDNLIVYAWAITSEPNVVHVVGAKYDTVKAGFAAEMIVEVLGDRLKTPQVVTLELPQLPGERPSGSLPGGAIMQRPARWYTDPSWLLTRMVPR
ncbi:MAG: hypothetical protein KF894_08945 [Labilithrix sp.]|nr:hypothetical protein [Labilithrix sp.]